MGTHTRSIRRTHDMWSGARKAEPRECMHEWACYNRCERAVIMASRSACKDMRTHKYGQWLKHHWQFCSLVLFALATNTKQKHRHTRYIEIAIDSADAKQFFVSTQTVITFTRWRGRARACKCDGSVRYYVHDLTFAKWRRRVIWTPKPEIARATTQQVHAWFCRYGCKRTALARDFCITSGTVI